MTLPLGEVWSSPLPLPFADKHGVRKMWKAAIGNSVDWFDGEQLDYPRAKDKIHLYPSGYKDWAAKLWVWLSTVTAS